MSRLPAQPLHGEDATPLTPSASRPGVNVCRHVNGFDEVSASLLQFLPVEVAFLDASVLYPAPLRVLLLELAVSHLYRARWSARVHEEWTRALLRSRPCEHEWFGEDAKIT